MSDTRILVVDDSLDMLTSLCKILELQGFVADAAYNGTDALRKIDQAEYDLILCDIEMQGLTGLDFLERIRVNLERDLDVVLMTGFLEHEYYVRAIQLGASDFLAKPIDSKILVQTIEKVLHKRKKKKELSDYYKHLEKAGLSLEIRPTEFTKFSLSRVVYGYLNQNFSFSNKLLNQVLSCLDEMAYNAFIHGTLSLSHSERTMDSDELRRLVNSRLEDQEISDRRIRFHLDVNNAKHLLTMSIEDDGEGFDHQGWLERIKNEPSPTIQEHGRGLALLYHFADQLEFSDSGRKTTVIKHLEAR